MSRRRPDFPFILDYKPRFFLSWFLYRLFKRVHLNQDMVAQLKQMNRDGTVVYAIKYRSNLDYLLYHFRFLNARLPFPKLAFDLNMSLILPLSDLFNVLTFHLSHLFRQGRPPDPSPFLKAAITDGITSMLCLVDPKAFRKHYLHARKDYLHLILETQEEMDKPIYIVPVLVLYKKAPEKERPTLFEIFFGFKDKPGTLRKIILFFRHHRRAFIDFGTPLNVQRILAEHPPARGLDERTETVRQTLIDRIDQQKRIILGPVMKSRQQLKVKVLKDPTVFKTLKSLSGSKPSRLKTHKKEAARYFDEIAADYNIAYIEFANMVLSWVWKKMFEGIDVNEADINTVRAWARKGPLIYIPSHKSHIDYLVLNYILYHHHMHIPRIAAGRNLNFWPMGNFFRKSGAFFIRRSFKGERLYATIFKRYIKALLAEGHPLEFFIEGGRSRSGKLILPKIGFLSILIEAFKQGYCNDLIFVPASIAYDRIIEENAYLKELSSDHKQGESFRQVMRASRFLKKKYGKIYIRFGTPLSINTFLGRHQEDTTSGYKGLAFDLIRAINRVTLVTPFALMAAAILTRHRRGFQFDELMESIKIMVSFLERYQMPMASTSKRSIHFNLKMRFSSSVGTFSHRPLPPGMPLKKTWKGCRTSATGCMNYPPKTGKRGLPPIPAAVETVVRRLRQAGHQAYIVGGAVRDALLNRPVTDLDVATSADTRTICHLFGNRRCVVLKHDTVTVVDGEQHIDVTPFRGATAGLTADLAHRDFTINAMAVDIDQGDLIDPHGGYKDIRLRRIRAVNNPRARFQEDPIRLLRAIRFQAELSYTLSPDTRSAITPLAPLMISAAPERMREEILKILMSRKPSMALNTLHKTGLLVYVMPELLEGHLKRQNDYHLYTVFKHTLETVDRVRPDPVLRVAALLHDIAKPRVRTKVDGVYRFYGHERQSARMAETILNRLRFNKALIRTVTHLIRHHLIGYTPQWRDAAVRRLIQRVGRDHIMDLIDLRRADLMTHTHAKSALRDLSALENRIETQLNAGTIPEGARDLCIDGHTVMRITGMKEGPQVGRMLRDLTDMITEAPHLNTKEQLIDRLMGIQKKGLDH